MQLFLLSIIELCTLRFRWR